VNVSAGVNRTLLSGLYAIADAEVLAGRGIGLKAFAEEMRAGGVRLLQYRNKVGPEQAVLRDAAVLREVFAGAGATLIMNDRADLAVLAGFDGVHVGQGDLSPEDARRVVGVGRVVGVSTHTADQVRVAEAGGADYVAIGPVFRTGTKADAAPVVGLEGVRMARGLTRKPLVAIGGITLENVESVVDAGADAVAVISALVGGGQMAGDFLARLG
jgi:thiamine-phosphate pyrophosphorylase